MQMLTFSAIPTRYQAQKMTLLKCKICWGSRKEAYPETKPGPTVFVVHKPLGYLQMDQVSPLVPSQSIAGMTERAEIAGMAFLDRLL